MEKTGLQNGKSFLNAACFFIYSQKKNALYEFCTAGV